VGATRIAVVPFAVPQRRSAVSAARPHPVRAAGDQAGQIPLTARLSLGLGNLLRQVGWLGGAAWAYSDALVAVPNLADAHLGLGEVRGALGHWQAAATSFRAAVDLLPSDIEAQGNLVLALTRAGCWGEGVAAARRLIELRPGDPELHVFLGLTMRRAGQPGEAIRAFRWAARLASVVSERRFVLGEAVFGQGPWRAALASLDLGQRLVQKPAVEAASMGSRLNARPGRLETRLAHGGAGRRRRTPLRRRARALVLAVARAGAAGLSAATAPGTVASRWVLARILLVVARMVARPRPDRALRSLRLAHRLGLPGARAHRA
jgi:tetratricopeptide (TPR) repeat protein